MSVIRIPMSLLSHYPLNLLNLLMLSELILEIIYTIACFVLMKFVMNLLMMIVVLFE